MAKKIVDETLKFNIIINGNEAKKEYGQLERAQRKILDSNKDLEDQAKKMEKANKQSSDSYRKLKQEIEDNNKTLQKNEKRMSELSHEIGINNLTMRELGREARKLGGILSNLDPESEKWAEYNKQLQAVKGRMANLREEMKPVEESMDDHIDLLGSLTVGFTQLFTAMLRGDYQGAAAGISAISTSIKGATKAAWAFIATPLGAALATVVAAVGGIKFWADYNEALKERALLTQQITGLEGEAADATRRHAEVMEKVYGADFNEILGTANGIVREFGGTFEDALNTIEKGLQKGQINNNEYFDSLQEYDTFFAAAQFSAEEFRRVIETGYDLGVYSDKLPDAIKEADLAIREQTDATRDALVNAFGAMFTDDLLRRVEEGKTSTKQALQEISAEAHKNGINIQQNAQLTADLFKGAGEDAGGALKIFEALNIALNEQERALTPLEEMIRNVADANKELAKAQDDALKSDNYVALSNDISIFWTKTKTAFFQGIKFIIDGFSRGNQFMVKFWSQTIATVAAFPQVVKLSFIKVKNEVFDVVKTFGGLGDVISNLMDFNFEAASDSFTRFKDNFKKEVGDVTDVGTQAVNKLLEIRKAVGDKVDNEFEKNRQAAAAQTSQGTTSPGVGSPINPNNGNGGEETKLSPEDKKKIDSRKKMFELLDQMDAEREIQEQLKKVEKSKRDEEEEILRIEAKFLKLEEEAAGETEILTRLEEEKLAQIQDVRDKYIEIQQETEEKAKEKLAKIEKAANDKLLQERKGLSDKIIDGTTDLIGRETKLGQLLLGVKAAFAAKEMLIQLGMLQNKIAVNTAAATADVAAGTAATAKVGFPQNIPLLISFAAQVAGIVSAIKGASAPKTTSSKGYEDGLYPVRRSQDGKIFNSRFGGAPSTQIVPAPTQFIAGEVKPEMIIDGDTFKKMDPAVTNYILGLAGKAVPGFQEGRYPQETGSNIGIEMLVPLLNSLNERLSEPLKAETYYGAEASLKQQEYDKKIRNARVNAKIKK